MNIGDMDFTIAYALNKEELSKLSEILIENESLGYSAFLISFLKELKWDVNKAIRVMKLGVYGDSRVIHASVLKKLIFFIKEAVILSNYRYFIEEDGFIKIVEMSNREKFKSLDISRQKIIKTLKKYKISYTKRK